MRGCVNVTKYILDHAVGRDCTIIYEGKKGVSRRIVHILSVDEHRICGLEDDQLKTFRRDRILAATWFNQYVETAPKKNFPPKNTSRQPRMAMTIR